MPDTSPAIANEFLRLAHSAKSHLTQMQLQKLVYIAHGWNLAINNAPLTTDDPKAWDYGPVYDDLREALKRYGSGAVTRLIRYGDYFAGRNADAPDAPIRASLSKSERSVIDRVYRDYGAFHAFKLSALTHMDGTPWTTVYDDGEGRFDPIPANLIRGHFVRLARGSATNSA